jgi:hypothetical protein
MANKKVSQLTSKPSVLVTDLFPIADPSTGQLYKTTISDLGTAIGSGVSSVNGLVGAVVLDTDDVQELVSPTNKWFTDTRARAAISAGTGISYNSGTGVITNAVTSGQIATALGYTPANGANYLPIVGGTMLGAIFGTIATFESSTSVTALGINLSGSTGDGIKITHSAGRAFNLQSSGSGYGVLINNTTASTSAPFTIQKQGANKITFSDLGAGIFASGLTAETLDLSNTTASNSLRINHTNLSYHAVSITATGGSALYATGSVTVVGSLTATGVLTAQSGLANGSGQSFALPSTTGTLALTSQLSAYLPLSGGTLTGALSGTSATFSGNTSGGFAGLTLANAGTGAAQIYLNNSAQSWIVNLRTDNHFSVFNATSSTTPFLINTTGAATFSSSVTAGTYLLSLGQLPAIVGSSTFMDYISTNISRFASTSNATNTFAPIIFAQYSSNGSLGRDALAISSSGNVGIGTTAPDAVLAVHGQFKVKTTNGDGNENRLFFNPGGAADPAQLYLYNEAQSNTIYITANGASYFNSGNFLIGTTTDNGAKLQVNGTLNVNATTITKFINYNNRVTERVGNRNGTGTYSLFTNGSGSTQSSGSIFVEAIYGTPNTTGQWMYKIGGNRDIYLSWSNTTGYSGSQPSVYWSGSTLYVDNTNPNVYYSVTVRLNNIGIGWYETWGNFPGLS